MTDGLRTDIPLAEVREAVAAYVKDPGSYMEPWTTANHLAPVLRFDRRALGRDAQRGWNRLHRQVTAELNRLAEAGLLVKVGGGGLTPDGWRLPQNGCRFYTRAGYERASRRAADFAAEQAAARDRAEAICARLRALVLPPSMTGSGRISLDLDHWELLLDLAEKGAQR